MYICSVIKKQKNMKSNIQRRKEELRKDLKNGGLVLANNSYDFIGFELKEIDENGENYFVAVMADSDFDEIKKFFTIPTNKINRIIEWYAGEKGGIEFTTDNTQYCQETLNTLN